MSAILESIKGKKTYILGVLGVVGAVVGFLVGDLDLTQAVTAAWVAIQSMNIRNAIG